MSERMSRARLDELRGHGWLTYEEATEALAEIERAWGECERLTISEKEGWENSRERMRRADELEREHDAATKSLGKEIWSLRDRLAHAHDAANGLLRAASSVVEWWNLEPPARFNIDGHASMRTLRAAIDPALSTAVLAETQRRDGLDEQIRTLTADRDEWRRIAEEQAAMLLTRGPTIGQEVDLGEGRKATITEAWSNGAGWYVDVRHPDGSKGRMAQEGGVWRESHGPALDAEGDPLAPYRATGVDRSTCPHPDDDRVPLSGDGWLCSTCGAATPPPEMATTTGEPPSKPEECNARNPEAFICTLAKGHGGAHVAHGFGERVVAEWAVSQ